LRCKNGSSKDAKGEVTVAIRHIYSRSKELPSYLIPFESKIILRMNGNVNIVARNMITNNNSIMELSQALLFLKKSM